MTKLTKLHPNQSKVKLMKKIKFMWNQRDAARPKLRAGEDHWKLYQQDVLEWLRAQSDYSLPSLMVGIPDISELRHLVNKRYRLYEEDEYIRWFNQLVKLIIRKVHKHCYSVFYQTDRNFDNHRLSKSNMVIQAANVESKCPLLWHKIVTPNLGHVREDGRPSYSHVMAFSFNAAGLTGVSDVLPLGHKSWANATSSQAVELFLDQVLANSYEDAPSGIVDLFAGEGTVMVAAVQRNKPQLLPAIGVELDDEHCNSIAQQLTSKPTNIVDQPSSMELDHPSSMEIDQPSSMVKSPKRVTPRKSPKSPTNFDHTSA